jgi:hypothetical protein
MEKEKVKIGQTEIAGKGPLVIMYPCTERE